MMGLYGKLFTIVRPGPSLKPLRSTAAIFFAANFRNPAATPEGCGTTWVGREKTTPQRRSAHRRFYGSTKAVATGHVPFKMWGLQAKFVVERHHQPNFRGDFNPSQEYWSNNRREKNRKTAWDQQPVYEPKRGYWWLFQKSPTFELFRRNKITHNIPHPDVALRLRPTRPYTPQLHAAEGCISFPCLVNDQELAWCSNRRYMCFHHPKLF